MTRINRLINCYTLMNYNCLNLSLIFEELPAGYLLLGVGTFDPLQALDDPYQQVIENLHEAKETFNDGTS